MLFFSCYSKINCIFALSKGIKSRLLLYSSRYICALSPSSYSQHNIMHVYILNTKRFSLFIYFLLCIIILARANTDKFFGSNNQLSNSHVNYIYQDSKGYIWICTENGLNLFDGIKFKTFTHIANDTTSLNNNLVLSVLEDSCGKFWVGTSDGVQILDRETGLFQKVNLSYRNTTNFNYIKK